MEPTVGFRYVKPNYRFENILGRQFVREPFFNLAPLLLTYCQNSRIPGLGVRLDKFALRVFQATECNI